MNIIDFLQSGGYRLKQATFGKMQSAYLEILKAFIAHLDIPDAGAYIISGCAIVEENITPGMMYIDGELCEFSGSPGTGATKIKKQISVTNLPFKNGSNLPVFRATKAIVAIDGVALSGFARIQVVKSLIWGNIGDIPEDLVYDANYVHTDNNFTDELKEKLDGLDTPNFTENNPLMPGFIKNKPQGNLLTYLYKNSYPFSNPSIDEDLVVTFPDLGTSNYMVLGSLVSTGANFDQDNDVIFTIRSKTSTSFHLLLREVASASQSLLFDYVIIPL